MRHQMNANLLATFARRLLHFFKVLRLLEASAAAPVAKEEVALSPEPGDQPRSLAQRRRPSRADQDRERRGRRRAAGVCDEV
jgi:hypothetical protein